jgi:hypothetical protein
VGFYSFGWLGRPTLSELGAACLNPVNEETLNLKKFGKSHEAAS